VVMSSCQSTRRRQANSRHPRDGNRQLGDSDRRQATGDRRQLRRQETPPVARPDRREREGGTDWRRQTRGRMEEGAGKGNHVRFLHRAIKLSDGNAESHHNVAAGTGPLLLLLLLFLLLLLLLLLLLPRPPPMPYDVSACLPAGLVVYRRPESRAPAAGGRVAESTRARLGVRQARPTGASSNRRAAMGSTMVMRMRRRGRRGRITNDTDDGDRTRARLLLRWKHGSNLGRKRALGLDPRERAH